MGVKSTVLVCSFEDGLRLVDLRGKSMQLAADAKPSAMVSVIGLDADTVGAFCFDATFLENIALPISPSPLSIILDPSSIFRQGGEDMLMPRLSYLSL